MAQDDNRATSAQSEIDYRDIAMLFIQARERLASGGCMYVLFSSDSDLDLLGSLISRAGFTARLVAKRSILRR
jgi:release factor glutamine methyltransferase